MDSRRSKAKRMDGLRTAHDADSNFVQPVETQMSKRRLGDSPQPNYVWLVTFTDIMGLMLTFFVMIFAMSEPEKENWQDVSTALQSQIGKVYGMQFNQGTEETIDLSKINFKRALDVRYLEEIMRNVISSNEALKDIKIIKQPGHIILSMPQDLLFEPGKAEIKDSGRRMLYTLGGALNRVQNRIEVNGHADPRPIQGQDSAFKNNWELSLARALNVAAVLENVGYQQNIDITGYGSGRYQDLQDIKDETYRQDIARRVDIIIQNHTGKSQKISPVSGMMR